MATRASPWGVFVVSFEEEPLMSYSPASTGVLNLGAEVEDDFVLDVKVVLDDATRPAGRQACDTSNGCPSTCESSCASAV